MLNLPLPEYSLQRRMTDRKPQVFDIIRKAWVALTPEEHVRQLLIQHLTGPLQYPISLIAVEKRLLIGSIPRRFDLVVYDRQRHEPWMLAECKAPEVPISQGTLQQLLHYHSQLQCRFWLLTNGHQHYCADAADTSGISWMDELPAYEL